MSAQEEQRPLDKKDGVVLWTCPSTAVPGLVVSFYAHASWRDRLPGKSVFTRLKPLERPKLALNETSHGLRVMGLPKCPACPICGNAPKLRGMREQDGNPQLLAPPPAWNTWWLECCPWTSRVKRHDPRILLQERNLFIRAGSSRLSAPMRPAQSPDPDTALVFSERKAVKQLLEYVKHDVSCTTLDGPGRGCDCGLEQLATLCEKIATTDAAVH